MGLARPAPGGVVVDQLEVGGFVERAYSETVDVFVADHLVSR